MQRPHIALFVATLAATLGTASPTFACGEGIFYTGESLRHQGYLAPRPATVLVYVDGAAPSADRLTLYRGMARAGHRLTIVRDAKDLPRAMRERRYDVVIASLDAAEEVAAATPSATPAPKLLPVVERSQRNAPSLRDRFARFVLDGASLGQYLKQINSLMKG